MPDPADPPPIVIASRADEVEPVVAAIDVLIAALAEIRDQPAHIVLDALMSVYLRVAIGSIGIAHTDSALERARENLARIAARMQGTSPEGHA